MQDPCIGEAKKLRVRYLFRDRMHEVTLDDTAALRAPVQGMSHLFILYQREVSLSDNRSPCPLILSD